MAVEYTYKEGNITAATVTDIVELDVTGFNRVAIQVTGTYVGTLAFEATANNDTWVSFQAVTSADGTVFATGTTGTGLWLANCGGLKKVRVNCSAYTSGTAQTSLGASQ